MRGRFWMSTCMSEIKLNLIIDLIRRVTIFLHNVENKVIICDALKTKSGVSS